VRVRLVFCHRTSNRPGWPHQGYDFAGRKDQLAVALAKGCPGIEFLPTTVGSPEEAWSLVEADRDVAGYLVYLLGGRTKVPLAMAAARRPMVLVDDLYGGTPEFLRSIAAIRRVGLQVVGMATSRLEDVVRVARCFKGAGRPGVSPGELFAACEAERRKVIGAPAPAACTEDPLPPADVKGCLDRLRTSTILLVGREAGPFGEAITRELGTRVVSVGFDELNAAYERADRDEARQWADRWIREAERVVEPSRDDVVQSGSMYLAMRDLLELHRAQAITIDCLGGFYGGHIRAYPCLGFCQLNDDGRVGACEADLRSTVTMLTLGSLTGRPGFISDPVVDTALYRVVYAHCVAPTRVFGPDGTRNPYHLRSHAEDRKGVSIRSLLPLGYLTTTLELDPARRQVLFHQGRTVDNVDEERGCRTKLAVEPRGDIDALLNHWDRWRWHRVTWYGDLERPLGELADALRFSLIPEAAGSS